MRERLDQNGKGVKTGGEHLLLWSDLLLWRTGMNTIVAMSFNVSQRVEHYQPESAKSHLEPDESELAPVGVCAPIGAF